MNRAILRYHGGKWRLAPWILSHVRPHRVYTEAFFGAGSIFFRKARATVEIINDLDGEIVNLFRVLRNPANARELRRQLKLSPHSREEFEQAYITDGDPIEQARRTLIKSHQGFGSSSIARRTGYRIYSGCGRNGKSTAAEWGEVETLIETWTQRLAGVYIENRPALSILKRHDHRDTLHYVDPPYVHATRSMIVDEYHHCYNHEMSDDDHRQLAACLRGLKGMVLLSGYQCPLYDELFGDWLRVDKETLADGAKKRTESLWLNPAAQQHQQIGFII